MMPVVVVVGTLDTKDQEYAHVRARLVDYGCEVVLVDTGVQGEPGIGPDVARAEVASAAGVELATLQDSGDRGFAVETMGKGAAQIVRRLREQGRLDAVLALGGSGGTSIGCAAMRALPIGIPKVMVSTMAAGNTRAYVGSSDIAMFASVVDIAGVNQVSARILDNAAAAAAAMADVAEPRPEPERPLVGVSMIGLTMRCDDAVRTRLDELGYEALVFHATGAGGQALEVLARDGRLAGVIEATPTELVDELCDGVCTSGPERLSSAGAAGIPQVVSLGGLDMVNFGAPETVPDRYRKRRLHVHNPTVTLMRTNADEKTAVGRWVASKLNDAVGPVSVYVPDDGLSLLSEPGGPFEDHRADAALVEALLTALEPGIRVVRPGTRFNDATFGRAMADELHGLVEHMTTQQQAT